MMLMQGKGVMTTYWLIGKDESQAIEQQQI